MISPYVYVGLDNNYINSDVGRILDAVLNVSGFTLADLRVKTRKSNIVLARQILFYLLKKNTQFNELYVVELLQHDRCTIIHSVNKIETFIKIKDKATIEFLEKVYFLLPELQYF
jgi:chromosomal replication initiation ATPase DnaA